MIAFFVPGTPVPQPRPQVTVRGGHAQAYVKAKHPVHAWRELVAATCSQVATDTLEGPLDLQITLYLARPKSHYGTGRNAGQLKKSAPAYPAVRPDIDNYAKAIQDALDGVLWKDDGQVVKLTCWKRYLSPEMGAFRGPGCMVSVSKVEGVAA